MKKSKLQKVKTVLQIIFLILLILSALPALFGKAAAAEDLPIATLDNADFIPGFSESDNESIGNIFHGDLIYQIDNNLPGKYADGARYFFGFKYELNFMHWFDTQVSNGGFAELSASDPALAAQYVEIYNDCKKNVFIGTGFLVGFTFILCIPIVKLLKVF